MKRLFFALLGVAVSIAVLYSQTPDPGRGGVWVSGAAGQRAGSDATFNTLAVTSTAADAIDVAGGLTAGSGNVAIIDTSGKLPALSATYLASLSGAALTSLDAGNISAGTLVVGRGGTGATTLTDGGVLLGSGTGAVTALAALSDGVIVIGDGSGDPTTLDVGASGGITILGTIATGVWNGTAVTAGGGGTGATSLTDGGVLLGSGTGAVTALAALGDGAIVIGDGSGDPTTLDVGSSTAITVLGTVATGTWQATDVGVAYGGTGASTLTDGGVLLGSGSGAISALAVLSDSQMIVGDGSGDPVAESGATLRTSIGVGTGDSLTFTGLTVSGTGASALDVGGGLNIGTGDVALIGTDGKLSGPLSSTIIDDLSGANLTTLNASNLSSGTVATARLGSGTASSSTFLRGDGSWQTVGGGSPGGSDTQVQYNDGGSFGGDAGLVYAAGTDTLTLAGPLNVAGASIFNDAGNDVDFRIESDDNQNMLFVDGGSDVVGIGTGSPITALSILKSWTTAPASMALSDTDNSSGAGISFYKNNFGTRMAFMGYDSKAKFWNIQDTGMDFATNDTVRITIKNDGNVGIGETDPGSKFTVSGTGGAQGSLTVFDTSAEKIANLQAGGSANADRRGNLQIWGTNVGDNDSIAIGSTGSAGVGLLFANRRSDGYVRSSMFIESTGEVGIGVTDPESPLHIGFDDSLLLNLEAFRNTGDIKMNFYGGNSASATSRTKYGTYSTAITDNTDGGEAAKMTWDLKDNGSITERMVLDHSGNLTADGTKSFLIDHPMESMSQTTDLKYYATEGPRADLIYRGEVALVAGVAEVNLDSASLQTEGTFLSLVRDPQIWVNNATSWTQVRGTLVGNILTIESQTATNDEVHWLVIADRYDEHMQNNLSIDETTGRPSVELFRPIDQYFDPDEEFRDYKFFALDDPQPAEDFLSGLYGEPETEDEPDEDII